MLKNYLKTALRNLIRNKAFAVINVLGLVIGITGAIVIFKIISFENSFETYHSDADRVYRAHIHVEDANYNGNSPSVMHPFGPQLANDFPDWEVSRIHWYNPGIFKITNPQGEAKLLKENRGIAFVEQAFFSILDFDFIAGDGDNALIEPNTITMSKDGADKLFGLNGSGYQDVIGRTIEFENKLSLKVTAIYENAPKNTDYALDYLMFYEGAKIYPYANGLKSWGTRNGATRTLVKVPQGVSYEMASNQLKAKSEEYFKIAGYNLPEGMVMHFGLDRLTDLHLLPDGGFSRVDESILSTLAIIAVVLIVIAAINFVNLATAQSVKRAKEIGIRKVLGGSRKSLVTQFLGEVFLITLAAVLLSLGLSEGLLMQLEPFLGYSLGLNLFQDLNTLLFLVGVIIVVTFLSGFYPAMVLSKSNPVSAIKNSKLTSKNSRAAIGVRRSLVVFQFLVSQIMIIGTIVIISQMSYMKNSDVGFRTEDVVSFMIPDQDPEKLDLLKSRLTGIAGVDQISFFIATPGAARTNNQDGLKDPRGGDNEEIIANRKNVDANYGNVFDLQIVAGEFYKEETPRDQAVINRNLSEKLGFEAPDQAIGQRFETNWGASFMIKGVVEDFHNLSMRSAFQPVYMLKGETQYFQAAVTLNTTNYSTAVDEISQVWSEVFTDNVFEHFFLDDQIVLQYETEQRVSELLKVFAGMAILICCLGLYGLISFMANQRVKEIGIRKVLGATIGNILTIFSREVMILVGIAFVIAGPLSYYALNSWLDSYEFRIELGAKVFILGAIVTVVIASATVGTRALKAALANPVSSLRDE